jgi:hypothetical protein
MADVLIVYSLLQSPPLATVRDALYAFERYSGARCWYLNLGVRRVPRWMRRVPFDAVIFQTSLLWDRVNPATFDRHRRKLHRLDGVGRHRVALPQDEYRCSRALVEFIAEFNVDHVFSVASDSQWGKLYAGVDRGRVGISRVLTGYLESETVAGIDAVVREQADRPIAIGYRAARALPSLGRHGRLKSDIAVRVAEAGGASGLPLDIATGPGATIRGDDWYRFLASCRYTLGVEGGASVHDPDGSFHDATVRYLAGHPGAPFEEVETNCFPGADGALDYVAISPRHLEACATRTAQILVEGSYNGILRPGEHYIELRRDLSNLDAVLELVKRDGQRARITEKAYRDVVGSGAYTYARFVREVEAIALAGATAQRPSRAVRPPHRWARMADRLSWVRVAVWVRVAGSLRAFALRVLPEPAVAWIRRRVAGTAAETASLQSAE